MADPIQNEQLAQNPTEIQQQAATPRRNPGLTDAELNAVSYFAIGVGSEGSIGGRDVSNKLSFAGNITNGVMDPVGNSGFSIGTLQTDLGQHPEVARTLVGAYQDWARTNHPEWVLNAQQQTQTTNDLSRTGQTIVDQGGRSLDATVKSHLDEFLKSDEGVRYVHNNDAAQANKLMADVYTPLRETALYQNATPDDQVKLATIVGKAYNQSEAWGGRVLHNLEAGQYHSVNDVSNAVSGLIRAKGDYMESGRDAALAGADVVIALRNSNPQSPLNATWNNVLAGNPLVDPTRLNQDAAHPNLAHEYAAVKDLFLQKGSAPAFIHALDHGTTSMSGQTNAQGNNFTQDGMYSAGNNFVVWDRNGAGHAYTDGAWSDVNRGNLGRTANTDGSVDVYVNRGGTHVPLVHADPHARPLRAEVPGEPNQVQVAAAQTTPGQAVTTAQPTTPIQSTQSSDQRNGAERQATVQDTVSTAATVMAIAPIAIDKWTPEQQKVFESVKEKVQELGLSQDDANKVAARSVADFTMRKDKNPEERVDHVHASNANGDVVVRTAYMRYGDKEPIMTNDVRLKDAPSFEQSAAQIEQANQRVNPQQGQDPARKHLENQNINQEERPGVLQKVDDQIAARVMSSQAMKM